MIQVGTVWNIFFAGLFEDYFRLDKFGLRFVIFAGVEGTVSAGAV